MSGGRLSPFPGVQLFRQAFPGVGHRQEERTLAGLTGTRQLAAFFCVLTMRVCFALLSHGSPRKLQVSNVRLPGKVPLRRVAEKWRRGRRVRGPREVLAAQQKH